MGASVGVELRGLDTLQASLAAVTAALQDPATAAAAARLVAGAAAPPVDTGRLAASEQVTPTATGARLEYGVTYAALVHASQPWLGAAISASVAGLVDLYAENTETAWKQA
jgi:hypothetical protein